MQAKPLLLLVMFSGVTASPEAQTETPADELPSLEMLEFLADWSSDEGEWLAPEMLDVDLLESVEGGDK